MKLRLSGVFLSLILLSGCYSREYQEQYEYLYHQPKSSCSIDSPYYVVLLVDARHLDYSAPLPFLRTVVKHPSDGSKNGDIGHAWIYLKSPTEYLEGGQSGELYGRGYMDTVLQGCAQEEKNPASYLFLPRSDGFFQWGSGGHKPTYALKLPLSKEQYDAILSFISTYDFSRYSLQDQQCAYFVACIATLAGCPLEHQKYLHLPSTFTLDGIAYTLWEDPAYSTLILSSPDRLEESMMEAVRSKQGAFALTWYLQNVYRPHHRLDELPRLPSRLLRYTILNFS